MDVSIIIVNWNSKAYLRDCLLSILATTRGLEFEIIVIDSASFDGCAEMLSTEFPAVRFIQSPSNLGFSGANNLAAQTARGEIFLFLNPDTELVAPAVNILYSALNSLPDVGAIGGRLLNSDRTLQTTCVQAFPTILNQLLNAEIIRRIIPRSRLWGMRALFAHDKAPSSVDAISGACLMIRRSLFEEVGRFSMDYFMYAEDVDLCYKASVRGFTNYYSPHAVVVHHGGKSTANAPDNFANLVMLESISRFLEKTRGATYSGLYRLALSASAVFRLLVLTVLIPFYLTSRRLSAWQATFSKWSAICRWGFQSLVSEKPCFKTPQPGAS